MKPIDRRSFLKSSLLSAAAVSFADRQPLAAQTAAGSAAVATSSQAPGIIDTNVNLFSWPFRALKYRDTKALVAKLKKHRVIETWAGSFEALFSKDMNGVNARLAAECREYGPGFPTGPIERRRRHDCDGNPCLRLRTRDPLKVDSARVENP